MLWNFSLLTTMRRIRLRICNLCSGSFTAVLFWWRFNFFLFYFWFYVLFWARVCQGRWGSSLWRWRRCSIYAEVTWWGSMHPISSDFFTGNWSRYTRPPRINWRQRKISIIPISIPVVIRGETLANTEIFFVAGADFVLDESDDIRECERFLTTTASQDVLVGVTFYAICVCCNRGDQ